MCCRGIDRCMACCTNWRARFYWVTPLVIILSIIAILLYFPGYKARNVWNENAVETSCYILDHLVQSTGNSYVAYDCDCHTVYRASGPTTECSACQHYYYRGSVRVEYYDNYILDVVVIEASKEYGDNVNKISGKLNNDYPINTTIPCYYQKDDPKNFRLQLDDVRGWLIASYFFVAVIILLLSVWAILDIVRGCRKLHRYCRSERTRKIHNKRQKNIEMGPVDKKDANIEENKSAEIVKSETVASEVTEVTVQ